MFLWKLSVAVIFTLWFWSMPSFASEDRGIPDENMNTRLYYQAGEVQTEFFIADNQLYMVYLPMSESLFHCPGIIVERSVGDAIAIKFVRQSINDSNMDDDIQQTESIRSWKAKNPESEVFKQSRLATSPFAQFLTLPAETSEITFYQDGKPIPCLSAPTATRIPDSQSAISVR